MVNPNDIQQTVNLGVGLQELFNALIFLIGVIILTWIVVAFLFENFRGRS